MRSGPLRPARPPPVDPATRGPYAPAFVRIAWVTDVHLDWLDEGQTEAFFAAIEADRPDAVLVGGDIGLGDDVAARLQAMAERLRRPVHFVLGNHDYYFASVAGVRAEVTALSDRSQFLRYLPSSGVVRLSDDVAVVGHDGWADGRAGKGAASPVIMNDHLLIRDFEDVLASKGPVRGLQPDEVLARYADTQASRFALMARLADEAAGHLRAVVREALDRARHVVVLMHFPPFVEACWYGGTISDGDWLPHLACTSAGEVLRAAMVARPDRTMTVLCGHTHGGGVVRILANLEVRTGGARYGHPALQPEVPIP